jgi:hypothetical protein
MLLTRARAGMVLVGDVNTTKDVTKPAAKAQNVKGKGKGKIKFFRVPNAVGELVYTKAVALQSVCVALWESGRVATVVMEKKEKGEVAEES